MQLSHAPPLGDSEILGVLRGACGCKSNNCFFTSSLDQTPIFRAIRCSRSEVHYLSPAKKRDKIRDIILSNAVGNVNVSKARIRLKFYIGSKTDIGVQQFKVCKQGFCRVYGITEHALRQIVLDIKNGVKRTIPSFKDRCKVPLDILKYIKSSSDESKSKICPSALARRMSMAGGHKTMAAAEWMTAYFEMMGNYSVVSLHK